MPIMIKFFNNIRKVIASCYGPACENTTEDDLEILEIGSHVHDHTRAVKLPWIFPGPHWLSMGFPEMSRSVVVVTLFSNIIHEQNTSNTNLTNKAYPGYCKHVLCWRPPEKAVAYLSGGNLDRYVMHAYCKPDWIEKPLNAWVNYIQTTYSETYLERPPL